MLEVRKEPWAEAAWYLEDRWVHRTPWLPLTSSTAQLGRALLRDVCACRSPHLQNFHCVACSREQFRLGGPMTIIGKEHSDSTLLEV